MPDKAVPDKAVPDSGADMESPKSGKVLGVAARCHAQHDLLRHAQHDLLNHRRRIAGFHVRVVVIDV